MSWGLAFESEFIHDHNGREYGGRQAWCWDCSFSPHLITASRQRDQLDMVWIFESQPPVTPRLPQGHLLILPKTVLPAVEQAFKYRNLWWPFSFRPAHCGRLDYFKGAKVITLDTGEGLNNAAVKQQLERLS